MIFPKRLFWTWFKTTDFAWKEIFIFITQIQFKSSPFTGFGSASAVQKICFCVIDVETASGKQDITFRKMSFASASWPRCVKRSIRIVISNCPNECNAVCVCFVVS